MKIQDIPTQVTGMVMININQFKAAQNKAAIAQFLGDREMWSQALHQCYAATRTRPGVHMAGLVELASEIELGNALVNFESYGDLTVFDGDSRFAESHINLDIELPELTSRPKWCVN